MKTKLQKIFIEKISGEWGDDAPSGDGIPIIRTANFTKNGKIDFSNLVTRLIQKDARDEKGKVIKYSDGKTKKVIDLKKIEEKKLLDKDIIIEKSGGGIGTPVGRVVYFENPNDKIYLSNNFTQTLRVNPNIAVPKYIFYYLKYLYKRGNVLKYQNQTTGLFNLKLEKYLQEEVLLPEYSKQYAVVTQLDTIQKLIDKRIESIELLDKLIQSYYFNMFGDSFNNQKTYPLKQLKEITPKDKIISYGIVQPGQNIEDGEPYLKIGDIYKNRIDDRNIFKTSELISKKYKRTICEEGDVLITIRATVGEVALIEKKHVGFNIAREIALIRPDLDIITPEFLYQTFVSKGFQFLLLKHTKGSTRKGISLEKLRDIRIPLPPIELQKEFSDLKYSVDSQKERLGKSLEILQTLFQSVLQNAFNPNTEIDEKPFFKELIKRLNVEDLKGNKKRLQYLLELFNENKFDNDDDYFDAKDKLFDLIIAGEIKQKVIEVDKNKKIILEAK